ncbi:MAG TPA: VWA domain-containing protein [Microthrixaceae bacterium]|nr:VWA domain-containing protein [Microthrixaceae bacterium]
MSDFSIASHHNEHLPEGGTEVVTMLSITSAYGATTPSGEHSVIVIMGDKSGSMRPPFDRSADEPVSKMAAARDALSAAIDHLADGTEFAVIAGNHQAEQCYPEEGGLVVASDRTRAAARRAIQLISPGGGTAMSTWLAAARELFESRPDAIRLGILVTDGKNESEEPEALDQELERCAGVFQCECRGVGTGWVVEELRRISGALLGGIGMIRSSAQMQQDFSEMIDTAVAKRTADVSLRLWVPRRCEIVDLQQVAPVIEGLMGLAAARSELVTDFPTGAWATERRDYLVRIRVAPGELGDDVLAARASVVIGDEVVAQTMVRATWTDDPSLSSPIAREVAHYTGQAKLSLAIRKGLAARNEGRTDAAEAALGAAVRLATAADNTEILELLERIVDVVDAAEGVVRLRSGVDLGDEMELDTKSTKTQRVKRTS